MSLFENLFTSFKALLVSVLPTSPFAGWISYLSGVPYLGWINWFIPMGTIVSITATWVSAIALYYIYSAVLRWLNMVE